MARYIDLMGYTTGTGTSFAAVTGSPYAPKKSGRLVGVIIVVSRQANTSIAWAGDIQLKCPSFGGVDCIVPFGGIGEAAADIVETGSGGMFKFTNGEVDLAVVTGSNIVVEYRFQVTPTTPELYIYGMFEG